MRHLQLIRLLLLLLPLCWLLLQLITCWLWLLLLLRATRWQHLQLLLQLLDIWQLANSTSTRCFMCVN